MVQLKFTVCLQCSFGGTKRYRRTVCYEGNGEVNNAESKQGSNREIYSLLYCIEPFILNRVQKKVCSFVHGFLVYIFVTKDFVAKNF